MDADSSLVDNLEGVPLSELAELIHRWPPAVINHMTWRQWEN